MRLLARWRTAAGLAMLACAVAAGCASMPQPAGLPAFLAGRPGTPGIAALPTALPEMQVAALKTKSDLPPVIPTLGSDGTLLELPDVIPPAQTEYRPPQPVHLLSGRIWGQPIRKVQALSLAGGRDHVADVHPADSTFAFANIDPWYYQMALVGQDATLLIRKVIVVEPARPVFVTIELQPDGTAAKMDGIPVPVEVR